MIKLVLAFLPTLILHVAAALSRNGRKQILFFRLMMDMLLASVAWPLVGGMHLAPGAVYEKFGPWQGRKLGVTRAAYQSDLVLQFHPWWQAARAQLLNGHLPATDPTIGAGAPITAAGQSGVFSPFFLPTWFLGPEDGTDVQAVWKLEAAGWGGYLLARTAFGVGRMAASAAAVLWAGSPYLIGWLTVPMGWGLALTPWIWLLLYRVMLRPVLALPAGLALGYLMGCGMHPESVFVAVAGAFLWLLARYGPKAIPRLTCVSLPALAVAFVMLAPTFSLEKASFRHAYIEDELPNTKPVPANAVAHACRQIVVPFANGHPGLGTFSAPYPYPVGAAGIGAAGLSLLIVGLSAWKGKAGNPDGKKRAERQAALKELAAPLLLGLVVAFRPWPVSLLLGNAPLLKGLTLPRFLALLPWSLALLAAIALDAVCRTARPEKERSRWGVAGPLLVTVVAALSLVGLDIWTDLLIFLSVAASWAVWFLVSSAKGLEALAVTVCALELSFGAFFVNGVSVAGEAPPKSSDVVKLMEAVRQDKQASSEANRIISLGLALPPNLPARLGLQQLEDNSPLTTKPLCDLLGLFGARCAPLPTPLTQAPIAVAAASGVKWCVALEGNAERMGPGWIPVMTTEKIVLAKNPVVLPYVRFCSEVRLAASREEAIWKLASEDGPLPDGCVVEGSLPGNVYGGEHCRASSVEMTPSTIRVESSCTQPALLLISIQKIPGWRCFLDGEGCTFVRVNLAFMGVYFPAGSHKLVLKYEPWHKALSPWFEMLWGRT